MTAKLSVAVTGGSGFVGRAVLHALLKRGAAVAALTRDRNRLAEFEREVHLLEGDISDPGGDLCDILAGHDVLLHLAWEGLPNYRSLRHFETELPTQYRFLKGLVAQGLKSLVVAGTCFEYGMQDGELSERMACFPSNPYGFAKDALRRQLEFLKKEKDFNLTWARLFYMYGDGQPRNSVYSLLSAAVERGETYFDMSAGEQLRDYLPIDEVAEHLAHLSYRRGDAGIVNICSGIPRSVRGMVEHWLAENNWRIGLRLGRHPYPDYEPFAFWGSAKKLHSLLNEPKTPAARPG